MLNACKLNRLSKKVFLVAESKGLVKKYTLEIN